MLKQKIIASVVYIIYRTLLLTWRVRIIESETLQNCLKNKESFVMGSWHGNELAQIHIGLKYPLCALTSNSKDGEIMSNILNWFHIKTARGSSSRNAVSGLKALLRLKKEIQGSIFAVDGPRGPFREIKAGIFEVAKLTKSQIFVSGVATNRAWVSHRSWNKAFLPKPFAKIVIVWSDSFGPLSKEDDPRSLDLSKNLKQKFDAAEHEAQRILAQW